MLLEFTIGHGLLEIVGKEEVAGFHHNNAVELLVVRDVFSHASHVTNGGISNVPMESLVG